jgi:hypothetical protein
MKSPILRNTSSQSSNFWSRYRLKSAPHLDGRFTRSINHLDICIIFGSIVLAMDASQDRETTANRRGRGRGTTTKRGGTRKRGGGQNAAAPSASQVSTLPPVALTCVGPGRPSAGPPVLRQGRRRVLEGSPASEEASLGE